MRKKKKKKSMYFSLNSHDMIFFSCLIFVSSFVQIRAHLVTKFGRKSQLVTIMVHSGGDGVGKEEKKKKEKMRSLVTKDTVFHVSHILGWETIFFFF